MRYLEIDPSCFLVEMKDLGAPLPAAVRGYTEPLERVVGWAREYLCRPHPQLGREGPVCPYVQAAMDKGLFFLTVCPGRDFSADDLPDLVMKYRDWFLDIEPRSGGDAIFKTILLLFPDLPLAEAGRLIDLTQEKLKPGYVAKGLMIGEFHAMPPKKGGLWNPDFLPLNSPVPLLAIRHMVPTDFAFLKDRKDFVASYLEIHGDAVPVHIKDEVRKVAEGFGLELQEAPLHPRVRAAFQRARAEYRVHRHADQPIPIHGPADFARALGYPLERITKSLLLRCQCHGKYLVVVCSVNKEPSLSHIARMVGCKRLEIASSEELAILLGYPAQGVPPMAVGATQVIMDEALLAYPTILTAAGEVEVEVELAPGDLRRMSRALLFSYDAGRETGAPAYAAAAGRTG
jgi:prolyl-tRNA editing enzyme YbaK/EbsC (Cys-tRNA(Pro) deacylase)